MTVRTSLRLGFSLHTLRHAGGIGLLTVAGCGQGGADAASSGLDQQTEPAPEVDMPGDSVGVGAGGTPSLDPTEDPMTPTGLGEQGGLDTTSRDREEETCARAELTVTRTIPTVWLLVDGSGSMGSGLGLLAGPSRWALMRQALLDPNTGLVARLQTSVSFGLMIYDGGLSPPGVYIQGVCPRMAIVDPALNNFAAIDAAFPALPMGASTPTHYALEELSGRITQRGPNAQGPTYVILATDGRPNLCDFHDGIPSSALTEQQAVATVQGLAGQNIGLFAISMAGGDPGLQAHLQAIAAAGNTGQPAFEPDSQDALESVLSTIIGGTATCDVQIEGSIVEGRECAGDVRLNGTPLTCNAPDGFRVKPGGVTLELLGDACKRLQQEPNPKVEASFACEDVVVVF